ncbi:AAEL011915-PA, partial [Aedes aegypti]
TGLFEPRYDLLPMELILIIFKQITTSDRLAAGETCSRWNEASHYYGPFLDQTYYHFDRVEYGDHTVPFKYFTQGFRYYPRLVFTQVEFNKHSDFWEVHGLWITELTLRSCVIRKKKFLSIMRNLLNLRRLELMQCDELFKNWTIEYNTQEPMFPFFLLCLKHLSLSGCDYFNEFHFERFITMAPNLQSIDVSNCFINLYLSKRITMLDRNNFTELQFGAIVEMMPNLTVLDLSNCFSYVDSISKTVMLRCILRFINQALQFKFNNKKTVKTMKTPGFISFLTSQPNLVHLDLSQSLGVTDEIMELITNYLPKLKTLKLRRCILITDEGIMDIVKLEHLEVLDLSNCERISDRAMFHGVIGRKIKNLKELYLCELPSLSDYSLIQVTLNFELIEILDLSSSPNAATDATMQYINFYLVHLRQLILYCCTKVTDAGLTGIDLPYNPLEIWDISESFSIDRLFKLRVLNLNGCYKITDLSLQKGFKFGELKELHLARCSLITEAGIADLVVNNKSIEHLDLSECPNINDYCIELITANLKRLKTLRVNKCPLLTDDCLCIISLNCQYIKHVSVNGCFKLSRVEERLSRLPTMKVINS